ncbi:MAG: hypothetical protein GXO09_05870 [Crenarchaeota archaeon]|nr:hypothetical protein [Thermoproteota archaeon]
MEAYKTAKKTLEERLRTYRDAAAALTSARNTLNEAASSRTYMDKTTTVNKKVMAVKMAMNAIRIIIPSPVAQIIISVSGTALTPFTVSNILPRPRSIVEAMHEAASEIRKILDTLQV